MTDISPWDALVALYERLQRARWAGGKVVDTARNYRRALPECPRTDTKIDALVPRRLRRPASNP